MNFLKENCSEKVNTKIINKFRFHAFQVFKEEKLQENSKELGTYMLQKLAELKSLFPVIGDVRGKGLMIGMELVENPETREPLNVGKFRKILEYCRDSDVIIGKGGVVENVSIEEQCVSLQFSKLFITGAPNYTAIVHYKRRCRLYSCDAGKSFCKSLRNEFFNCTKFC